MLSRILCRSTARATRCSIPRHALRSAVGVRYNSSLVSILEREIQQEEARDDLTEPPTPANFKVHETTGSSLVKITRSTKGEDVTVQYTIPKDLASDDSADGQMVVPVDVILRRAGKGGLECQCTVEHTEGSPALIVQRVAFFEEGQVPTLVAETAEADYQRDLKYGGPLLADLETDVQEGIAEYLETRGINDDLAGFIWDHVRVKENKEYIRWMKGLQSYLS